MIIHRSIILLSFFLVNICHSSPVLHDHGERSHQHPLPSMGLKHEHGNNVLGSMRGTITPQNNNTRSSSTRLDNSLFVCENLPNNIHEKCIKLVKNKRNKLIQALNIERSISGDCYVKGSSNSLVKREEKVFKLQVLTGDLSGLISTYDNIAMCHWSSNNFKAAKSYIDNYDLLFDIIPLVKGVGIGKIRIDAGRPMLDNQDTYRWYIAHQAVRFIENTLRTRHRYLCKGNKCQNLAWRLTQKALSNNFQASLFNKLLTSSNDKTIKLIYNKRKRLIAQEALLKLAVKEKIIPQGVKWASYIRIQINKLSKKIYASVPQFKKLEMNSTLSIRQVKNVISNDETIVTYLHSIECRVPLVWTLSKKKTSFKRAGLSRKICTTAILKQRIASIKHKIINNGNLDSLQGDLQWLSKQLIDPIALPKAGSKLIFAVDETMAGLPFELLKTKSGKMLGDIYDISYTPSTPLFTYLKAIKKQHYKIRYTAFSKDQHGNKIANLRSNKFIKFIANGYNGKAYTEANESDIYGQNINSKLLHFITHSGSINGKHGLFYGRSKNNDGIVTGEEIIKKSAINADTVLITSCDSAGTNTYQDIGEAYSDLSKGFLVTGSNRVIITRWAIPEKVAHLFVTRYLEYTEKNHLDSSTALRKVRSDIRKTYPNTPKNWAAWIALGA